MEVPLLDLRAQYATIKDQVRAAVDEVFENQRFVLGTQVSALEEEISKYCGVPYAIGVASGRFLYILRDSRCHRQSWGTSPICRY
jgi:dTDP-4-amino-4,6-dideoxygalactose transaminase